jgi:ribosomal 50S subunit-recycling heat shock protein
MIAKYHGRCARTGAAIKPGDVITFTTARKAVLVKSSGVSDVIQFGDNTFYRNKAGRCEDAPCCGCCTI